MKEETVKNKRLLDMTGEELASVIKEAINGKSALKTPQTASDYHDTPRFVTGIKDAARVLGISPSTIARWKKSGEYDDCIFQSGKIVQFDMHKMMEKMRASNQEGKYGRTKYNNKK